MSNMNGNAKNGNVYTARYTAVLEQQDVNIKKRTGWFGTRHFVTFMLFLGMANAYIMRTNMSVAIVAMVNHSAIESSHGNEPVDLECGPVDPNATISSDNGEPDGEFAWQTDVQGYVLSSFFYGYVITQIPFGILSKRYGNIYFLGVGMLINSVFGLLVPISANMGIWWLIAVRFIQGLGECLALSSIGGRDAVDTTRRLMQKIITNQLALTYNWSGRNGKPAFCSLKNVVTLIIGAQFGTVISMPLSGLLSVSEAGWPSIFYVFGAVGTVWCVAFLFLVHEDPESHPRIDLEEKKYIQKALGSKIGVAIPPIPWKSIVKSLPFWAILLAHMGHNYGYETLMTELPTYMKQVLHFSIRDNGFLSALPYLAMWIFSIFISHVADWMLTKPYFTHTIVRKIINGIGQFGPAIALVAASFTGCDKWLTVAILTVGVGLNGGIYSGFKVNHLDISPQFAGILMSLTNCLANLAGLLAPIFAGNIVLGTPTQAKWRIVFVTAAAVYAGCCTFYVIFGSGKRQPWDTPEESEDEKKKDTDTISEVVVTTRA